MIKVFFDTNVLIAAPIGPPRNNMNPAESVAQAQQLWQAVRDGRIAGYVAAFSIPTIFSLAESEYKDKYRRAGWHWQATEKQARRDAYNLVNECCNVLQLTELYRSHIDTARTLTGRELLCNDFEDNLQLVCAVEEGVFTFVTFNKRDFICAAKLKVEVVTPNQLLTRLGLS